jgi:hypothetical protein
MLTEWITACGHLSVGNAGFAHETRRFTFRAGGESIRFDGLRLLMDLACAG